MNSFTLVDGSHLIKEEKKDAITLLIFLAKKRGGRIKVIACADGRGQRVKFEKEDAAYPKFAIEIIFITSVIDAHEGCDVAIIYIPGAFLHADSYEHIIMVFKGKLTLLMCNVEPKLYMKNIIFDKGGKPVLYFKMLKAIYGLLKGAFLFYHKLVKNLQKN